jgi:subtilisin family serine protease
VCACVCVRWVRGVEVRGCCAALLQADTNFDGVYNYGNVTGAGVELYVLDTGIALAHAEFGGRAGRVQWGADCTGQDQPSVVCTTSMTVATPGGDCHGHGTHCAGIAGGR